MHDFIEPMIVKFNEMIGKYQPARNYEFNIESRGGRGRFRLR